MATANRQSDRLAWGISLFLIGILYLIDKTGVINNLPFANVLTSAGTYFLIAGITFLIYKKEKATGIILTVIGLIIHSDLFFSWMKNYSNLIVPLALIVAGLLLIIFGKKR